MVFKLDWIYGNRKKWIFVLCAVLLLAGTFFDLPLSQTVFNKQNPFALFFASFGEYPSAFCCCIGCGMIFASFDPKKKVKSILLCILAIFFFLFSSLSVFDIAENTPQLFIPGMIAEIAISLISAILVFKFCDRKDRSLLLRLGFVFIFASIFAALFINVIKGPWARPRFRSIVVTEGLEFQPWYQFGNASKEAFVAGGMKSGEFKSFPSGHAASAAGALSLVLLPLVIPQLRSKQKALTIIAFAVPFIVMFSRIMAGAHFLSDVTVGFFIQYCSLLLTTKLFRIDPFKQLETV